MKQYFRYFKWLYIVLGAVLVIYLFVLGEHAVKAKLTYYDRTNTECITDERVFDYADVLTDQEEDKLRKLIDKREKQTGCDIVLVTLDEPLEEYATSIDPWVSSPEYVRIYAEQFYEECNMGYNAPNGDGVILVDNWSREDDGEIHTWLCTTGRAKETYSYDDSYHLLDIVYRYIETNPYRAYKAYVNSFYHGMMGTRALDSEIPQGLPWIVGFIAAVIFLIVNWNSKKGDKTVNAVTYVAGHKPEFTVMQDRFLRKSVVTHKIETNTSSGGGGGHSGGGGGGGSHGGAGHSR